MKSDYFKGFLLSISLLCIGIFINFIIPNHSIPIIKMPNNIFIILGFLALIVNLSFINKSKLIDWFSSIPATISAISSFSFLVFLMAIIPQEANASKNILFSLGFNNLTNSWEFLFASFYLLLVLGFVIMKRIKKFNFRNFVFILNHLGLWIIIVSAFLGSADTLKFQMTIKEGRKTDLATKNDSEYFKLPFEIELIDFKIDEYSPEIILIDPNTGSILNNKKEKPIEVKEKLSQVFRNLNITILTYIESSIPKDTSYISSDVEGSIPAAYIEVKHQKGNEKFKGWVTCGNNIFAPKFLAIDDNIAFAMSEPAPKKYHSLIKIHQKELISEEKIVEVNKPIEVGKWKLYQIGYDSEMGKWSKYSTFELVYDPWIMGVYIGIYMLLIGSLLLFWVGKNKSKN